MDLPSNMFAAVQPGFDYVVVDARRAEVRRGQGARRAARQEAQGASCRRRREEGSRPRRPSVQPPFATTTRGGAQGAKTSAMARPRFWRVLEADFVSLDAGTGIVHVAPAFGEDDHRRLPQRTAKSGAHSAPLRRRAGRHVQRTAAALPGALGQGLRQGHLAELKAAGALVHAETYRHEYPFCWRADSDPLIQYARPAWYIRTTAQEGPGHREQPRRALAPGPHQGGALRRLPRAQRRLGAVARALLGDAAQRLDLRETKRRAEHRDAPAGTKEILERNPRAFDRFHAAKAADPSLSEHLIVHKPSIDEVVFPCTEPGCDGDDAARARGHRLLVRLGLHAVRAVGLPARGARRVRSGASRPISSPRRSTRRAGGSTRCS